MSAPGYPGFPTSADATLVAGPTTADPTSVMGPRVVAGLIDALLFVLMLFFIGPTPLSPFAEYATNNRDLPLEEACDLANAKADAQKDSCIEWGDKIYWTHEGDQAAQTGIFFGFIALYIVLQGLTGFTPGKLLLGLRAVGEDGRASVGRSLVRTVLWIVDVLPCFALLGFIVALTSTGHRRVGDMAAKTFVVRKGSMGQPIVVPGMITAAAGGGVTGVAPPQGYGTPTVYPSASPYPPPTTSTWGAPPQPQPPAPAPENAWGAPPQPSAQPQGPFGQPQSYSQPQAEPAEPPLPSTPEPPPTDAPAVAETMPFGAGAATPEARQAAEPPATVEPSAAEALPATGAETAAEVESRDTPPPASNDASAESSTPEPDATVEEALPTASPSGPSTESPAPDAPATEEAAPAAQGESQYKPQWDAARGAYIQWDPNRSRWLQWDDTTQTWNPI